MIRFITCVTAENGRLLGMPKAPKFDHRLTAYGWQVDVPAAMASGGKRERRYFKEEKEAKRFAQGLRARWNEGRRGGLIPADLAFQAAEAAKILEPHGISLIEAARAAVARIDSVHSPETFLERFDKALLDGESRWSAAYRIDMERLPRWVGKEFMARRLCDITPAMIDRALSSHGAAAQSTLDHRRRYVRAIMGHKPRHRRDRAVSIMKLSEAEGMLAACENDGERRTVAVLLWAGIRPMVEFGEIARLDWSAFSDGRIYVGRDVSKTGSDRFVPITPRLAREIEGHPAAGPVAPANWKRRWQRIRRDAGVKGQDITRHTFASHFLAAYGEHEAKEAMGHTAGSSTLFRHYRAAVTREDGLAFFS